jgi:beta-glucosidase
MEVLARTGKPVILCLMAGSDIDLSYAAEHFDAILDLWYPGSEGGHAAAKLLFGEASPSGKLPVTFYETVEELPDFEDYSMKGRTYRYMEHKAQYPFGYGLTYGRVRVVEATAGAAPDNAAAKASREDGTGQYIRVRAAVKNEGLMASDEVVQIYVKNQDSEFAPRNPVLCAFQRIHLEAGEQKEIWIPVSEQAFTVVDAEGNRRKDGTHFTLYVGCSQPDERSAELLGVRPVEVQLEL